MAERNEIGRPLGGGDRRDPRDAKDVALFASPERMRASVAGCIAIRPPARASRLVTPLSATSTMAACPLASKWVK
jgi:hypothetical protein